MKSSGQVQGQTDPKLVIVSWWTLLDKGTVVRGYVAVVAVFLQHVDFCFDLLLFLLRNIHHLDGSQLACLHVTALILIIIWSVKFHMNLGLMFLKLFEFYICVCVCVYIYVYTHAHTYIANLLQHIIVYFTFSSTGISYLLSFFHNHFRLTAENFTDMAAKSESEKKKCTEHLIKSRHWSGLCINTPDCSILHSTQKC